MFLSVATISFSTCSISSGVIIRVVDCPIVVSVALGFESQGVETHLLDHGGQPVGPCGRKVGAQADGVDEVELRIEYFAGRASVEHADQQRDDSLGMMGIDWAYGFDKINGSSRYSGSQFHFILGQEF